MLKIGLITFTLFFSLNVHANLCSYLSKNNDASSTVKKLATKLNYSYEQLCTHPRILAIQDEERSYYYSDSNDFENHLVITLHYSEYSCEYHYNSTRLTWNTEKQYCYNTW